MGNRLYIHTVDHPPGQGLNPQVLSEVAEYSNGLPGLWQVMLSAGATAGAVADPSPYLVNPALPTLYVERVAAESRLRAVLDLLAQHAHFSNDAGFLQRKQALLDVFLPSLPGTWFAFNLDELAWFEDDSSDSASILSRWTDNIGAMWRECEAALRQRHADALANQMVYGPDRAWTSVLGMESWSHTYFQYSRPAESWTDFAKRDRGTWRHPTAPVEATNDAVSSHKTTPSRLEKLSLWIAKSLVLAGFLLVGGVLHALLQWAIGDSSWWRWPLWGIVMLCIGMVLRSDGTRSVENDGDP